MIDLLHRLFRTAPRTGAAAKGPERVTDEAVADGPVVEVPVQPQAVTDACGYAASAAAFVALLPELLRAWSPPLAPPPAEAPQPCMTVVVSPWFDCPVGFFSTVLGLAVAQGGGWALRFLIDDMPYPQRTPVFDAELAWINRIRPVLEAAFPVLLLSEAEPAALSELTSAIVREAVAMDIQHRIGNQILGWPVADETVAQFEAVLMQKALRIETVLAAQDGGAVLVPGGMVNGGWAYTALAEKLGIRSPSYDSGPGLMQISVSGVAARQLDIPVTYAMLLQAPEDERRFAIGRAREMNARRQAGGDDIMTVAFDRDGVETFGAVLCMNFEGDTAAIGLDRIFSSAEDWLVTTVAELARLRPGVRIAVRQHPDERRQASVQSMRALERLRGLQADGAAVTIFDAGDNTSTYELAKRAKVVVAGTSTIGIEAAMLGKTVVSVRDAYYARSGFVQRPETREEYTACLLAALDAPSGPDDVAREHACLMYYVLEACSRTWCRLTPQPADFAAWVADRPLDILHDTSFAMITGALGGGIPCSLAQHRALWKEQAGRGAA